MEKKKSTTITYPLLIGVVASIIASFATFWIGKISSEINNMKYAIEIPIEKIDRSLDKTHDEIKMLKIKILETRAREKRNEELISALESRIEVLEEYIRVLSQPHMHRVEGKNTSIYSPPRPLQKEDQ